MSLPAVSVLPHADRRETKLVNLSNVDPSGIRPIDRRSEFGNPFRLESDGGDFSRRGSVGAYINWFEEKIYSDSEFRLAVNELRGEMLGCWCVPKLCHGHVILYYLHNAVAPDDVEELQQFRSDHLECRAMNRSSQE